VYRRLVDKGGTARAGGIFFFLGKGKQNHQFEAEFLVHHRIVSAVKRVEVVSARMSYIGLRGRWCNIYIFMCVHQVGRKVMIQRTVFIRIYLCQNMWKGQINAVVIQIPWGLGSRT
jgi:hypothetical protein